MTPNGKSYHRVSAVFSVSCDEGATQLTQPQCLHRAAIRVRNPGSCQYLSDNPDGSGILQVATQPRSSVCLHTCTQVSMSLNSASGIVHAGMDCDRLSNPSLFISASLSYLNVPLCSQLKSFNNFELTNKPEQTLLGLMISAENQQWKLTKYTLCTQVLCLTPAVKYWYFT